jgi:hypothetical protein
VSLKDFEQPQYCPISLFGQHLGVKISFARLAKIDMNSPANQLFRYAVEPKPVRFPEQGLPCLQKAHQLVAQPNRHGAASLPYDEESRFAAAGGDINDRRGGQAHHRATDFAPK